MEGDDHGEAYTAIVWSGLLSRERYKVAGAETVENVEGNMLRTVMRGATALPWSKTPLRPKGTRRNLGGRPQSPRRSRAGSERRGAEAGSEGMRRPYSTDEASNNTGRQAGGGECGGKGRRKGMDQRMPRTQSRTRHVPDGLSPRTGTGAQAPNASDLRQEPGAEKPHAGICAGGGR